MVDEGSVRLKESGVMCDDNLASGLVVAPIQLFLHELREPDGTSTLKLIVVGAKIEQLAHLELAEETAHTSTPLGVQLNDLEGFGDYCVHLRPCVDGQSYQ